MGTTFGNGARRTSRRRFLGALAVALATSTSQWSQAATPTASAPPPHGTTRELHEDALRKLPLNKLTPQGRGLTQKIINDTTIFRRLPQQTIECRPELFHFMVENPELVINMWEVMGVTNVSIKKIGAHSYRIDDGQGTSGDIHFLYKSPTHYVLYCDGTYTGTLMPRPLRGRCIISMTAAQLRNADETDYIQCRLDSFVQLDNLGVEVFARTFQTMIGGIADHNFRETTGFVSSVSVAAESAPENLHRIAGKCRRVAPDVKQKFLAISDRIYAQAMGLAVEEPTTGGDAVSTALREADAATR